MSADSGLFLNEDCNHFVYTRSHDQLTPEGVDALIDGYVQGTQVSDVVLNPNASRSSIPSKFKQTFWDGFDPSKGMDQPYFEHTKEGREIVDKCNRAFLVLQQRGIDLYERWLSRSRKLGARGWLSIRMNDCHNVDEARHVFHDRIWVEHPEYWRANWREFEWPGDRTLDYSHPAVVEQHVNYTRECIERYDFDGLELDWMRQPWCFRPGREEEGLAISERVVREARQALDERGKQLGRRLKLLVRVPSRPDAAMRFGFDPARWAKQGLVDVVAPSPDFATTEFDMPIEVWRHLLDGTGAALAAGLEITLNPFPFAPFGLHTIETVRGAAAGLFARGAQRIYLFNYMDAPAEHPLGVDGLRTILAEVGSLDTLAGKPRRHVLTFQSPRPAGDAYNCPLPYRLGKYGYRPSAEFRLPTGPAPRDNEPAHIRLGLEAADAPPDKGTTVTAFGRQLRFGAGPANPRVARELIVRIDGVVCPFAGDVPLNGKAIGPTHAWQVPAGLLQRGDNVIEVSNRNETALTVTWVEAAIGDCV